MYAGGAEHPLRRPSVQILEFAARSPAAFLTSVEVVQEMLHRYLSARRWRTGRVIVDDFMLLMAGRIEPIYPEDVLRAADLADRYPAAQARDLLHAAVMQRLGIEAIVSADRGLDAIAGVRRFDPSEPGAVREYALA